MLQDEKVISEWAQKVESPRPVSVYTTNDSRSESFREFGRLMAELAPSVAVKIGYEDEEGPPEIRIHPNIVYKAVPKDQELKPFLHILSSRTGEASHRRLSDTRILEQLSIPAVIKVYVSPNCSFCPQTVESLAFLACRQEMIHLFVIDAFMFPEQARADNVSSVPTVFVDGRFRLTGRVDLPEIIDLIVNRDPAQLSSETLKQILYDGKAAELAKMMADSGKVFPSLYELLTHTQWPVRLGAMATVEYLGELSSELIAEVVQTLWEHFEEVEDPVKGDILYLFGETAHPDARMKIEAVMNGPYTDLVKEAASDAMASF